MIVRAASRRPDRTRDTVPKKAERLVDSDLHRWYANVKRGSETTPDRYVPSHYAFSGSMGVHRHVLLKFSEERIHHLRPDYLA